MTNRASWFTITMLFAAALGMMTGCDDKPKVTTTGGPGSGGGAPKRMAYKAPAGAQPKIAFITNNVSAFWNIAKAGVAQYEKESGIKVDVKQPQNGKVEEQNRFLEDLVSQGYNGIAISVIAPEAQTAEINKACEKANVVTHDSDAPAAARIAYIGTVNYEAGKRLGQEIVKLMPDGGKVAVFVGMMSADNARQRFQGLKDAVSVNPKIEVMQPKEDQKSAKTAMTNVESVIGQPGIKMLVGLWSYNGPAIASVLSASGKKGEIKAAVFDEEDGTLQGIKDGVIECTVVQKPYQFGYRSAKLLHELAMKGEEAIPKDPIIDTGVEVITNKPTVPGSTHNVDEFSAELAKLKAPQ
ncbi:MAG: ABC-type sugar transport system, periplasmic component [Phycisphaerales bacterium]|nr:ABC-type sugar transport system, periplasmic component [Phycisphaerales bacterium]